MRVGERPVLSSEGIARGGRIVVWSIPKRASEGAPLKVEKLKASECLHLPVDDDGYCTACGTELS
jgi:hypothetical protein